MYEQELYVRMKLRELKGSRSQTSARGVPTGKPIDTRPGGPILSGLRRAATTIICRITGARRKDSCRQVPGMIPGGSLRG